MHAKAPWCTDIHVQIYQLMRESYFHRLSAILQAANLLTLLFQPSHRPLLEKSKSPLAWSKYKKTFHSRQIFVIYDMFTMGLLMLLLLSLILQLVTTDLVPFDDWLYQRVALPDANIFFRYAGTGPPVLLVHGYPQHSVSASQYYEIPCDGDESANRVLIAHVACHWT